MNFTSHHTQMLLHALGAAAHIHGTKAQVEHGRTKLRALQVQLANQERTMAAQHSHRENMLDIQLSHDREMFSMKSDLLRDLIKSLIDRRVDAVQHGFVQTLNMYAEQCRHYMTQQNRYADAEIKATAPLERANLRARLSEIDLHLTNIRGEAASLYREMTKVILLIGGSMPGMSSQDHNALGLT
jgi:hypothetical protein